HSPGSPLDAATGRFMSDRIGRDFRDVRIHTDARADDAARTVGAHAYTVGDDIVFASGQYQPGTAAGRRLIAHELAHVVQQGAGGGVVRRQPVKSDVAIVLTDEPRDMIAGGAFARQVIRVFSPEDAAAKLKALGHPIGTLFVVSHSNKEGQ